MSMKIKCLMGVFALFFSAVNLYWVANEEPKHSDVFIENVESLASGEGGIIETYWMFKLDVISENCKICRRVEEVVSCNVHDQRPCK